MRTCAVCSVPHVEWLSSLVLATLLATTLVKVLVTTDDFYIHFGKTSFREPTSSGSPISGQGLSKSGGGHTVCILTIMTKNTTSET